MAAARTTFSLKLISVRFAPSSTIWQGTGQEDFKLPWFAKWDNASKHLRPATTANLPHGSFLTTRFCRRPTAAMASSTAVVRKLPFQASSLFSGISAGCRASKIIFLVSFARSGYWVFGRANTLEALAGESGGSRGNPRGITHRWSEAERAKRSRGLHKRSAEAWGHGLPPRGAAPISR